MTPEYNLTVKLERHGDQLNASYFLPGSEALFPHSLPWQNIETQLRPIGDFLDSGKSSDLKDLLADAPRVYGRQLFEVLFGKDDECQKILRSLFSQPAKQPSPSPIMHAVRLRICTDEPLLFRLPWHLTAWREKLLIDRTGGGWEFIVGRGQDADPANDCETVLPCNILVIAPNAGFNAKQTQQREDHLKSFKSVLQDVWPTQDQKLPYLRQEFNRKGIKEALLGMSPHLIYVYAHGGVSAGRAYIKLDGDDGSDRLYISELAEKLDQQQPAPSIVYLNVSGLAGQGVEQLGSAVPLVIAHRLPGWLSGSHTQAVAWLREWLTTGNDPVTVCHSILKKQTGAEEVSLLIHGRYRSWKTEPFQPALHKHLPRLKLNRRHQKALVSQDVLDLINSDSRRVMGLVAYGSASNMVESLQEQLQSHIESNWLQQAEINWHKLTFPAKRGDNLLRDFEDEFTVQLDQGPNEAISHLLRRHAPRVSGAGNRGTLWFDWGVFGPKADQQPSLHPSELEAWLRFSSEYLASHCPADLRIVSYLAIELDENRQKRLTQALDGFFGHAWCRRPSFRLSVLPPLGNIAERDLFDFLDERANSSCPANIQDEVARLLFAETGGEFETAVGLIEQAEAGSWYDLHAQLKGTQGLTPPEDDEPF